MCCVQVDYDADVEEDSDETDSKEVKLPPKMLTFYELDLGLNHVTRKWSEEVDPSANMLISVPGGADGPGGVLVCSENFIVYKNQVCGRMALHDDRVQACVWCVCVCVCAPNLMMQKGRVYTTVAALTLFDMNRTCALRINPRCGAPSPAEQAWMSVRGC